jgi:sortase (surface protein transpeptidase)
VGVTDDAVSGMKLGRRAFIGGSAGLVAGVALWSGSVEAVEPGASYFQVVEQRRLCDTRSRPGASSGYGYQPIGDKWIRVGITDRPGVPADAVAAVLTVTVVSRGAGWNYVTVFPSGESPPDTSSVNAGAFDGAVANLVTIKLGSGAVDLTSFVDCDLIVDLVGVYRPTASPVASGRLVAYPSAVRALDTRAGGQPGVGQISSVNLNGLVPADATAVVATLTAVTAGASGFVTAFPRGGAVPDTSNLNVAAGETRAVAVVTRLGTSGGVIGVDLLNVAGAHLLFDVVGYMTGPSGGSSTDGLFVPVTPTRVFDTRRERMRLWNGSTRQFELPAPMNSRAQAVAMNLTVTGTVGAGYFTVYAAQTPRYDVSNLNVTFSGQTIANHAITRVSNRGVACFTSAVGHVICDITGWFTGAPTGASTAPAFNPPPPPAAVPWIVQVPRMGLGQWVFDGDAKRVVDSGNTWHWAGTGLVGQGANIVMFGHRTSAGGPYRYQHLLRGGDLMDVTTSDGRRYTYQMAADFITSKNPNDILAACRRIGGETVSLVACSKPNRLPTSLEYRLVSTFQLLGWEDLG